MYICQPWADNLETVAVKGGGEKERLESAEAETMTVTKFISPTSAREIGIEAAFGHN